MSVITIRKAASILDVSEATVRNWVKHGYLEPTTTGKSHFAFDIVSQLKVKIEKGEINRLRKRANKRKAESTFIPDEYIHDISFVSQLAQIRAIFLFNNLDLTTSLFLLALRQLVLIDEVDFDSSNVLNLSAFSGWKRNCVKDEIYSWYADLPSLDSTDILSYEELYDTLLDVSHDDSLGIIYQSLLAEGRKSQRGMYYTPMSLIDGIFEDYSNRSELFLDPCCGTGQFLIRAARAGYKNPELLFGFDIDMLAVRIARLNLFMVFRNQQFIPNIKHTNTLTDIPCDDLFSNAEKLNGTFAMIATNPPWGAKITEAELSQHRKLYPSITSKETFSMFLVKAVELTQSGGCVSFILPESILNIRCHSDIRKFLLRNTSIKTIQHLGRCFKGVFTEAIRIDLIKASPSDSHNTIVKHTSDEISSIPQLRFMSNDNFVIDTMLSNSDYEIIATLRSVPYVTLKGNAEWALGIVTGNNEQYLSDSCEEGMEPVFRGSDIEPFKLGTPSANIRFAPELFQQVAPESKYRSAEKLVYKFISNRLVFAYDSTRALTLNSANICIPKIKDYPIKLILGLLNSKLYQFLFGKLFHTHKVLRSDLEQIPLPLMTTNYQTEIIDLVDQAIAGQYKQEILDMLVMDSVGLSKHQKRTVMDWE